ncbi:MAG: CDP-alcohol phosphatidyltransferase family protein [Ardenticatenales bacterium]|nr:CDP-alcohol phosphatidyltransferase family protein [Ardenticatenales bacterium]
MRRIPNPLTVLRLLLLFPLWAFALNNQPATLGLGLLVALLTDAFDGRLARRFPQFTNGRLDSLADRLLTLSVVLWLLLLRREIVTEHPYLIGAAVLLYVASFLVGWLKFGRPASLHLTLAKIGGLVQGLFVLHSFLMPRYSAPLLYLALGLWILAGLEEIAVQLAMIRLEEEHTVRSIFTRRPPS